MSIAHALHAQRQVNVPGLLDGQEKRRSLDQTLADNLLTARTIAGLTQQELADAAGVSRATVAQLETGVSDPRLSTIHDLAAALEIPALLLIVGEVEAKALSALPREVGEHPVKIAEGDALKIRRLAASGSVADRLRAARAGASLARAAGDRSATAPITAAIFTQILPVEGTPVGVALGKLLR